MTNEPMGKRLFPAAQVHNTLKRLVESGAISGSKADAWKAAMAEEAEVAAFRVKAEGGNARAMRKLGFAYRKGTRGLKEDRTQAFMWFKRAADLNDPSALYECGVAHLVGEGVTRSDIRGLIMIGMAAAIGSEIACYILGRSNEKGHFGLDMDPQEATRYYRKMQKCDVLSNSDRAEEHRKNAAASLREHL